MMEWNSKVVNYATKMALSLLKLKKEFKNRKLKNVKKGPEYWISDLQGLRTVIELIDKESMISERSSWKKF